MTSTTSRRHAAIAALVAALLCLPLEAQRGRADEGVLRQRLAAAPEELEPYLDLVSFYWNNRRFDDAERTVAAALGLVRGARQKAGQAPILPADPPTAAAAADSDESPRGLMVLREMDPVYPAEALDRGIGGSVGIEMTVGRHGLVTGARVTRSIPSLDAAALEAVRQWEFMPLFREGVPVPAVVKRTITFIPETIVTMPGVSRRAVGLMLAPAARFFREGAYSTAEFTLELLRAAITRERGAPPPDIRAHTAGITTSRWPVRGGVDVRWPAKSKDVPAAYPAEARQTRISGTVSLNFVIDPAGKVTDLRLAGFASPVLEQAARDVVTQWEYQPTVVGGEPIPVAMVVTLWFAPDRPVEEVVRVGRDIQEPHKIKDVPPVYPREAQVRRLQGVVIVETILNREGRVHDLRVLRSAGDLLDKAALEAVRQWEFTPTLMAGVPVQVLLTTTVSFSLK